MTALEALKRFFGYDGFRGGQETLINGILAGKDVLGVMPTGAGKSICFQVPSLMMDGIALVVSPLISLMKDQVNALTKSGVAAAYINTSLTQGQIDKALRNAANGLYKLIYVAPERLPTSEFAAFARSVNISMLAVDEAHCISQWGQDFRPSYTRIPDFIAKLPKRPIVSAFTATATPRVREDILAQLKLRDPRILIAGFDRKNLYLGARKPRNKYDALAAFLKEREGRSGIVYCGTRSYAEILCKRLRTDGYSVSRYHAGLLDKERHDNQDDFLRGRTKIMVATNAFGMGIDKSDVSFVLHLNMPKDIESYYQEAGRAGRDGEPAECILFYSDRDIRMNAWLLENDKEFWHYDKAAGQRLKDRSRERMREMVSYSTTAGCLRGFILKYFGENPPDNCGNCDRCNSVAVTVGEADAVKKVRAKKKAVKAKGADKAGAKKKNIAAEGAVKVGAAGKAVAAKIVDKSGAMVKAVTAKVADRVGAMGKAVTAKVADKSGAMGKAVAAKVIDKGGVTGKAAAAKIAVKTAVDNKSVTKKIADKTVAKKSAANAAKKKIGAAADKENSTAEIVTCVKITDKRAPVSAIAGRISEYTVTLNRREISAIEINEWLVSEGYIDTINDKGKNRKITTDKGISLGIITEIRKVGVERLRVNMFDRKAQELVVAKFCGTEGFGEGYVGLADLTETAKELCERFVAEPAVIPELTPPPNEDQSIKREEPFLYEHDIDAETLPLSDESTAASDLIIYLDDEQDVEDEEEFIDEHNADDEYDADAETLPPTPDSTAASDIIKYTFEEQAVEDEEPFIDEHGADAETSPASIETVKSSKTIFSIIMDALRSLGRIFSKRQ